MNPLIRFMAILVIGLALLAWVASRAVNQTTQRWFERDIELRAKLAVNGARHWLAMNWAPEGRENVQGILAELTRDERIMAAAACGADLKLLASTKDYPNEFSCEVIQRDILTPSRTEQLEWRTSGQTRSLPGGPVHISAVPLLEQENPLGFVVLVHDMSFIVRRETAARHLILWSFLVLCLAASLVTVIAVRIFRREWTRDIRRFLKGEAQPREFQPILGDVRELIRRITSETAMDDPRGGWTPQRLKMILTQFHHGEKVVIVANREPYLHERDPDGPIRVIHPASGLVTALEPVMRACSGVWIAHGSGSADRETVDASGRIRVPPGEESYTLRRVWLTPEEEKGYYYGFANEGLWPLCHIAHARPIFRSEDWQTYQSVNAKFVDAVCQEVDSEDPVILVQDYHFACVPRMIRARLPKATILTFWHIPWPNPEHFGICPWRNELLEGMLGSSILGFHTRFHCNNFIDAVDRFLEARIDRENTAVVHYGQTTLVRPYPISIEWPNHWLETAPPAKTCRDSVIAELKLAPNALIGVGVDRLDYTKGIEERLWAVEHMLERYPELQGRFTFVQLAAPSRTIIERYRQLNENIESTAVRINERFSRNDYRPVILLRAHHEPTTVFRYYRAADLCYVSSLHDGMNLVAKEFVAARDDERGVLVLSHFTGAARELTEALIVNPYDLDEAAAAMHTALRMSPEEQRDRMRSMRQFLAEFNIYRWAGRMLMEAGRLRWKDRLSDRLTDVNSNFDSYESKHPRT